FMDEARLWPLTVIGVAGLLVGLWPLWWMVRRAGRRLGNYPQHPGPPGRYVLALVASITGVAVGVAAPSLVMAMQTWHAFTKKTHVAELQALELGPHKLRVYLVPIDNDGTRGATEIYDVDGDEWQVGGDVVRFRPFLTALGVTPVFRLTRVEGR